MIIHARASNLPRPIFNTSCELICYASTTFVNTGLKFIKIEYQKNI